MPAIQGARERARNEITAAIKEEARRQLAAEGAAKLSLRAIARELGMVSSALYRYFPSRDDLLTALIIDAYDALGGTAERAAAAAPDGDPPARWSAVCAASRAWALAHPHEYALIYGSPVPGYSAPQATVGPAARMALVLVAVAREAHEAGTLARVPLPDGVRAEAERMAADLDLGLPPETVAALVAAWAELSGLLSFELFGQFTGVVSDREAFFAHAVRRLAHAVGLTGAA